MGLKETIQQQITDLQAELAVLNRIPDDTFNLGTVAVFSPSAVGTSKWYFVKIAEETWRSMQASTILTKDLTSWIFEGVESNVGYFEVYVLSPAETPIFASA